MRAAIVLPLVVLAGLCAVLLREAAWVRRTTSLTFDETYYLGAGLQTVHDRWLDKRIAAEGIAPLPILLTYVPPLAFAPREARPEPWFGKMHDRELIVGPRRWNAWLMGAPLVGLVFAWLYRRQGWPAAVLGAGLTALSPTIVAHASLATMDAAAAFFFLLAIAATAWYLAAPSWRRMLAWALAIAAAMTAKYSGVFLLPLAALLLLFGAESSADPAGWFSRIKKAAARFACLMVCVGPLWWGLHLFTFTGPLKTVPLEETPDFSPWVKILGRGPTATWIMDVAHRKLMRPAPLSGVVFQFFHNQGGHPAFLMGAHSRYGWWSYFPAAFAFKSTPAELVLAMVLIGAMAISLRAPREAWRRLDVGLQTLLVAGLIFIAMTVTAKINLGHRYLILLYPLLAIAATDRLAVWLKDRPRTFYALGGALLAAQLASNLAIGPHYLAYFNRLSGGPENGWRLLADSNIDWGQDLPALRQELTRWEQPRVAIRYFGTALPEAYGVQADRIEKLTDDPGDYDTLAISVSCLQGLYGLGDDPFREFRAIPPDARAGYSIFLYRLDTPQRQAWFRTAVERVRETMRARQEGS